jgi:hypothetical protein
MDRPTRSCFRDRMFPCPHFSFCLFFFFIHSHKLAFFTDSIATIMKLALALLSYLVVSLAAPVVVVVATPQLHELKDIPADSTLGMKLLANARQLDQNNAAYESTWISGYSIKFQGCHHISQWNEQANGNDDVRIATKRLVRFRLCPTGSCSSSSAKGCSGGYGDYIIDMNTYLAAYIEAKQEYQQFRCDYLYNYVCQCDNNGDDNYSQEKCLWDCYAGHNMDGVCMENNPYNANNGGNNAQQFNLGNYMYCAQASFNAAYYVGPYCASQGGSIYLGVFTDDACTTFADNSGGRETYYQLAGDDLPYGKANLVDMDCFSCQEPAENNNDGNDAQDADTVADVCETIYTAAGKCESNLPSGTSYSPNTSACNYMEGIKIVRKDGTVVTAEAKANKTASVFIGLFIVAFVLLSAYVYYLKTKLDRASINLAE